MHSIFKSFHFLVLLATILFVQAAPINRRGQGVAIHINSADEFCSYMPPSPGDDVGATEEEGKAFCTDKSLAPGARLFPDGFIQSAHYAKTDKYVQVTGTIDRSKYDLSAEDGGGQYDQRDITHSTCNGYKYFVNLIEPDANVFCIRCCASSKDCNIGKSTAGCESIVPGNYS